MPTKIDTINDYIIENTIDLNYLGDFKNFPLMGMFEMSGNYFQHYGNGRFIVIIANKIKA